MTCECKHEADIGELKALVPRLEESVKELVIILRGNNSNGFMTRFKGITTQLKIQWWFIGGITLAILGGALVAVGKYLS